MGHGIMLVSLSKPQVVILGVLLFIRINSTVGWRERKDKARRRLGLNV